MAIIKKFIFWFVLETVLSDRIAYTLVLIKMLLDNRFAKNHYLNFRIYICSLAESVYRVQLYWSNSTSAQYTRGSVRYTGGSVSLVLLQQLFLFDSS